MRLRTLSNILIRSRNRRRSQINIQSRIINSRAPDIKQGLLNIFPVLKNRTLQGVIKLETRRCSLRALLLFPLPTGLTQTGKIKRFQAKNVRTNFQKYTQPRTGPRGSAGKIINRFDLVCIRKQKRNSAHSILIVVYNSSKSGFRLSA